MNTAFRPLKLGSAMNAIGVICSVNRPHGVSFVSMPNLPDRGESTLWLDFDYMHMIVI